MDLIIKYSLPIVNSLYQIPNKWQALFFYIKLIHCTCFKGNAKFLCNKAEILETNLVLDTGREIYTYIIETCSSTIAPHRIFFFSLQYGKVWDYTCVWSVVVIWFGEPMYIYLELLNKCYKHLWSINYVPRHCVGCWECEGKLSKLLRGEVLLKCIAIT